MSRGALYNEHDPYAAAWLRNLISAGHIAPGDVDERDIRDISPNDLEGYTQFHAFAGIGVWSYALRRAGWPDDRPVWSGSAPCQPFSAAGKGGGFDDERHLWPAFHHLVRVRRPPVVFGEQVASKDGLGWLDLVQADLEGEGYAVGAVDTCAAGHGAPHIRSRLYWVADAADPRQCDTQDGRADRSGSSALQVGGQGQPGVCEPKRAGAAIGLANASSGGFGIVRDALEPGCGGHLDGCGDTLGLLGDSDNPGSQRRSGRGRDLYAQRPAPERTGSNVGQLAYSDADRCIAVPERRVHDSEHHVEPCRSLDRPGPTNGFWRDPDWLFCRDGKWRPVEPGAAPLVDVAARGVGRMRPDDRADEAVPRKDQGSRTGRLRGYGNAIVATQAETFIRAYLDGRPVRVSEDLFA